jgi:hypothetical protein
MKRIALTILFLFFTAICYASGTKFYFDSDVDAQSHNISNVGTLGAGAITGTNLTDTALTTGGMLKATATSGLLALATINSDYIASLTTSCPTNLTGFIKGNGSVLSADNSTYYKSGDSPSFTTLTHTGIKEKYRLITSADSLVATDDFVAVTGTTTITLPTAVGIQGTVYTIKNTGTAIVTIATTSSQTIDGVTTYVIRTTNSGVQIISDNANWLVKGVF